MPEPQREISVVTLVAATAENLAAKCLVILADRERKVGTNTLHM